jgi:hypothetical protein
MKKVLRGQWSRLRYKNEGVLRVALDSARSGQGYLNTVRNKSSGAVISNFVMASEKGP